MLPCLRGPSIFIGVAVNILVSLDSGVGLSLLRGAFLQHLRPAPCTWERLACQARWACRNHQTSAILLLQHSTPTEYTATTPDSNRGG